METSMRQIAKDIDLLSPPDSLKDLAARFRYPDIPVGSVPAGGISLRKLGQRIGGQNCKRLEFLHYNTYLMHCEIPLADFIDPLGGIHNFLYSIGADWVKETVIKYLEMVGSEQVCDTLFPPIVEVCGVSVNPLNTACRAFGLLADVATWLLDQLGDAFDTVFDLLGVPLDIVLGLLFEILGMDIVILLKSSVDIHDRAVEIGNHLGKYDLVSLCEVWQDKHRTPLLGQVPHGTCLLGPPGPQPGDWRQMGSGLLVFSPSLLEIVDGGTCEYGTRGICRQATVFDFGPLVDADHWSCKGVQLTVLPIPDLGTLEIYSTHLYSGGDMGEPMYTLFGGEPSTWEKALVREAQIAQLAQFIRDKHQPDRVAIIVGDFNVASHERYEWPSVKHRWSEDYFPDEPLHPGLYGQLFKVDEGLEFDDWYWLKGFVNQYPQEYGDHNKDVQDFGHTNRGGSHLNFDSYCPCEAPYDEDLAPDDKVPVTRVTKGQVVGHLIDECKPDYYCSERWRPSNWDATGNRIDYIFVQRPVAAHTFNLDVSRIRRRTFKRSTPGWLDEPYMSDHLGLEVTLFASPK